MGKTKILIPSFDFKPMLGGVANYVHEVFSAIHELGDVDIQIIARDLPQSKTYDQLSPFQIKRIKTPSTAALALPFWIRAITAQIKSFEPDLIFCPLWFPDASATYLSLKVLNQKIPYFIAAHGMEIFDSQKNLKHVLRKFLLKNLKEKTFLSAKNTFAVSHYTKRIIHENIQIGDEKIQVIPNGVNLNVYKKCSPREVFKSRYKDQKILLTVTRLHPYKGVDTVLKSLPAVLQQIPNLLYVVIGSGPNLQRLQKMVLKLKLQNNVLFLGPVSHQEILEHYSLADLFVLLSREEPPDVEGFGLVFLEALACGLPSLGGDSGGIPDAIENNLTGWLVDPLDIQSISEKIISILNNPDDYKKVQIYGTSTLSRKTWSSVAQKMMRGFREA